MTRCIITREHVNAAIDNKSFKEIIYLHTKPRSHYLVHWFGGNLKAISRKIFNVMSKYMNHFKLAYPTFTNFCKVDSASKLQEQRGFIASSKLYLDLCSVRWWLKLKCNLERNFGYWKEGYGREIFKVVLRYIGQKADYIPSNFFQVVFHKFYLIHSCHFFSVFSTKSIF